MLKLRLRLISSSLGETGLLCLCNVGGNPLPGKVTKVPACHITEKDKIESILADFAATDLYEEDFLRDLEEGLKKSSMHS